MTREETIGALQSIIEEDKNAILARVHVGFLIHAVKYLKEQPEIVRCKDCKWYKEGYDIDGKWFSRCNGSVRTYGQTKPDWFCADGERKNEDG